MTTVRVPSWLRDAINAPASVASVEPWALLSHWLASAEHIGPPPEAPVAVRVRYGGDFGADGTLAEDRVRVNAPRKKR